MQNVQKRFPAGGYFVWHCRQPSALVVLSAPLSFLKIIEVVLSWHKGWWLCQDKIEHFPFFHFTVTFSIFEIAQLQRTWRKKTNIVVGSRMSLWKTSINTNFFSWKQLHVKSRREWWTTSMFRHTNLSVVRVFPFNFRKSMISLQSQHTFKQRKSQRLFLMYYEIFYAPMPHFN